MSKNKKSAAIAAQVSTSSIASVETQVAAPVAETKMSEKTERVIKRQSKCTTVPKGVIPNWTDIIVKGCRAFNLLDETGHSNVKFKVIIELEPEAPKKAETVVVTQNNTVFNEAILKAVAEGNSEVDDKDGITVDPAEMVDTGNDPVEQELAEQEA